MPLIELTLPRGALPGERIQALAQHLMEHLLRWEGAPAASTIARQITWTYVHEVDRMFVAGSAPDEPRYRVTVTVPEGMLGARAKEGVVRDFTAAIVEAEGSADPAAAFRVWCLIHEVAEGNWGADGRVFRRDDIVELVMREAAGEEG